MSFAMRGKASKAVGGIQLVAPRWHGKMAYDGLEDCNTEMGVSRNIPKWMVYKGKFLLKWMM